MMQFGYILTSVSGLSLSVEEKELLQHPAIGGVIFFSKNFESVSQLASLVDEIRQLRGLNFILAVDQEGGRVQRFKQGLVELPSFGCIGAHYDQDPVIARQLAKAHALIMATELLALGLDISFTPVLDINLPTSRVIADRGFHRDPAVVADLGSVYVQAMQQVGMAATGKHYPGHGFIDADSHVECPCDTRSLKEIMAVDMQAFQCLIRQGLAAVMPAHVVYPDVDVLPAGFSPVWLQHVLRQQLGFKGAIFSDDLGMTAASLVGGFVERAEAALAAGCDMILLCHNDDAVVDVIETLHHQPHADSSFRLLNMLASKHYDWDDLKHHRDWLAAKQLLQTERG